MLMRNVYIIFVSTTILAKLNYVVSLNSPYYEQISCFPQKIAPDNEKMSVPLISL